MKHFKFEINLNEADLDGDEFWEKAIERDGTGIAELTEALIRALEESNLMVSSPDEPKDVIKLTYYKDE